MRTRLTLNIGAAEFVVDHEAASEFAELRHEGARHWRRLHSAKGELDADRLANPYPMVIATPGRFEVSFGSPGETRP